MHPVAPFAAAVRRAVGLPRGIVAHSMVALGHPAETKPSVDRFDPAFIHVNRW